MLDFSDMFKENASGNVIAPPRRLLKSSEPIAMKLFDNSEVPSAANQEERSHWQDQSVRLAQENEKLRYEVSMALKDKERDQSTIFALKQELSLSNNRVGAMLVEHRETRNQFLADKNDLEAKCFQLQALVTQVQGSIRKREKEFEKMQNQLSKMVKDSSKGGPKPQIVVSKPITKNSSQVKAPATLRDAELLAAQRTAMELETENGRLRASIDKLTTDVSSLQSQYSQSVAAMTARHMADRELLMDKMRELQQKERILVKSKQQLTDPAQTSADSLSPSPNRPSKSGVVQNLHTAAAAAAASATATAVTMDEQEDIQTVSEAEVVITCESARKKARGGAGLDGTPMRPSSSSLSEDFLTGPETPGCRPTDWLVQQAASEVKKLSQRMAMDSARKPARSNGSCSVTFQGLEDESVDLSRVRALQGEVDRLKAQLEQAMAVVHEQDALIHQALLGQLPGLSDWKYEVPECDAEREEVDEKPVSSSLMDELIEVDSSFSSFEDRLRLPPASPATRRLLESCGWTGTMLPPVLESP